MSFGWLIWLITITQFTTLGDEAKFTLATSLTNGSHLHFSSQIYRPVPFDFTRIYKNICHSIESFFSLEFTLFFVLFFFSLSLLVLAGIIWIRFDVRRMWFLLFDSSIRSKKVIHFLLPSFWFYFVCSCVSSFWFRVMWF